MWCCCAVLKLIKVSTPPFFLLLSTCFSWGEGWGCVLLCLCCISIKVGGCASHTDQSTTPSPLLLPSFMILRWDNGGDGGLPAAGKSSDWIRKGDWYTGIRGCIPVEHHAYIPPKRGGGVGGRERKGWCGREGRERRRMGDQRMITIWSQQALRPLPPHLPLLYAFCFDHFSSHIYLANNYELEGASSILSLTRAAKITARFEPSVYAVSRIFFLRA